MMTILDKEILSDEQKENKLEVIKILETFLKQSNSEGLKVETSGRIAIRNMSKKKTKQEEDEENFSWFGWTVVNGSAHDVATLIRSKLPFDPLMGMSEPK